MDDFNDSLRELIQRQRGVLSRQQLLNSGFSEDLINARLRRGRWRQIQLGVYATFTGEWSREVMMWAAVLRAGAGAALVADALVADMVAAACQASPARVRRTDSGAASESR